MGMSEREYHIKVLENLLSHYKAREKCEEYYDSTLKNNVEALEYAISSLKTDLKYDLLYEGEDGDTKADMVAMLEDLKTDIEAKMNYYEQAYKKPSNLVHETAMYERMLGCGECDELIQQKINVLKGENDE